MKNGELSKSARLYFRDELRKAIATAQSDAEGFQDILFSIERLGITLTGEIKDLNYYKHPISQLIIESSPREFVAAQLEQWHLPFSELYEIVREARNDALHSGTVARHMTKNAIRLALILEEASMSDSVYVREFMVRDPTCAYLWQPITIPRQQMLANGFTYLPIRDEISEPPSWKLLADFQIAKYLHSGQTKKKFLLARTIKEAVASRELELLPAKTCSQNQLIRELIMEYSQYPVLVMDDYDASILVGILTPFDLL